MPWTFGQLLRAQRERCNWGYALCARYTGVDPSYLTRLEADQRHPSRAIVARLCAAFALDPVTAGTWYIAAGYAPPALQRYGRWTAALEAAVQHPEEEVA